MYKWMNGALFVSCLISPLVYAAKPVKVGEIESVNMYQEVKAIAEVVSLREVDLATEIEGKVKWVAEVGKVVSQGELIAELNDQEHALKLKSHSVKIEKLKLDIEFAERERARLEKLSNHRSTSEQDLDVAKQKLANLKLALEEAYIDERLLQLNINRHRIVAPFDGQVVQRYKVSGAYLEKGERMLTLVDIGHPEISAKLPVDQVYSIQPDVTTVKVVGIGQTAEGQIKSVVKVGDELSRMVEVRILAPEFNSPIGAQISVVFKTKENRTVWKVPRDAVVLRQGGKFVYQVDENNQAIKIPVKVINNDEPDFVLVEADLHFNFAVIVRGAEMLSDKGEVVLI